MTHRKGSHMTFNDNPVILVITKDVLYFEKIRLYIEQHGYTVNSVTAAKDLNQFHAMLKINLVLVSEAALKSAFDIFNRWIADVKLKYIVITESSDVCETQTIDYLESGATDVVDKTIRCQLLLAKIRILLSLRDTKINLLQQNERIKIGSLEINIKHGLAVHNKRNIKLTTNEFSLLLLFIRKPNQIISRENLYQTLYKYEYDGISRSLDNTVFRIRRKLEIEGITDVKIQSIRGRGYCAVLSE